MNATNDAAAYNLGGDIFNEYIMRNNPEWVLKSSSGAWTTNRYHTPETAMDHGNMAFVDFFMEYFREVPDTIRSGRWEGTYQERNWNIRFLDNFLVWGPEWFWTNTPINPRTGKAMTRGEMESGMRSAVQRLREIGDQMGVRYFANIWSDVESQYFNRDIYPELMDYLDYVLFETWTANLEGVAESEAVWLRRVLAAQDIIQNRRAEPVVQAEFGNFWYAVSTLLLVRENGRGMLWSQKMFSDTQLQKMNSLDLGKPLGIFVFVNNAYQREWEKGKVIVNPHDSRTVTIQLGGSYQDVETGNTVSSVTLPPKTGRVLVLR